jgi:cysteine synthase A
MMRALGAEVILVDQCAGSIPGEVSGEDLRLVEEEAARQAETRGAFRADQFALAGNRNAHYFGTAPEIWSQSDGTVTAFCDFAGSGGTFAGCARFFREQEAGVKCFVVEPAGAAALAGEPVTMPEHPIQGGGYSMPSLIQFDNIEPDGYLVVTPRDAVDCAQRLAREEGVFAGFSSGANLAAALQLLDSVLPGATVAVIACDSGLKYLSTDLWVSPATRLDCQAGR